MSSSKLDDNLLGLLAVAHKYQYLDLFSELMEALESQPLDFNSWKLVNSAAVIYDSASLKAKSLSFAEAEVDNFLRGKNMEQVTEEFIHVMFDTPKISTVNQNLLVGALLHWRKTHSSADIRSVVEKICWSKVSSFIKTNYSTALLRYLGNEGEVPIWNQLVDEIQFQSQWIVLLKGKTVAAAMEKCDCNIYLFYCTNNFRVSFRKNGSYKEIPVKSMEFELPKQYRIQKIGGSGMNGQYKAMYCNSNTPKANNNWFKYSPCFFEAEPVYYITIYSDDFTEASEITLRNLVIY